MSSVELRFAKIGGRQIAYRTGGTGRNVVFLHGNPTSSYLWRNVLDPVAKQHRVVAPDLLGMGHSSPAEHSNEAAYSFARHADVVEELIDRVTGDGDVVLVLHDWGSIIGFDWARRHENRVIGVCFMEAIVDTFTRTDLGETRSAVFDRLRGPDGEDMVLADNFFIESVLPSAVMRTLTAGELDEYRRPFATSPTSRWPMLAFARQLPIEGEPTAVCDAVERYRDWLHRSPIPKLCIEAVPGALLVGRTLALAQSWPNTTTVSVPGRHYLQEDSAPQIAAALTTWLDSIPLDTYEPRT